MFIFPEVEFYPTSHNGEIGQPLTVSCLVSGVSELTSLTLYREGTSDPVCQIEGESVVMSEDGIKCSGQTSTSNGELQTVFSPLKCSDAGEYRCQPNLEASTPTTTQLSVSSTSVSFLCYFIWASSWNFSTFHIVHSDLAGTESWNVSLVFIYIPTLCVREGKALATFCICTCSSGHSLLSCAKKSFGGSFVHR